MKLTPDAIADLATPDSSAWLRALAFDWGCIVAAFLAFDALGRPWLALPLFALFIGCRQHALTLLGHDATHRSALPSRFWNERLGELLCAWPVGGTLDHGYRDWHFEHHRHLGTEADPELAYRGRPPYVGRITREKITRRLVADLLGLGLPGLLDFHREILPRRLRHYAGPLLMWGGLVAFCAASGAWWILGLWGFSLVAGFWAAFRMRTWLEHVGLELAGREGSHRFSAGGLARFLFFPHNTHCHYEHHLHPQVPGSKLPELRARMLATEAGAGEAGRRVVPLGELLARYPDWRGCLATDARRAA